MRSHRRAGDTPGIASPTGAVRRFADRLPHTLLDAGGPLIILLIIGVPLVLIGAIIGLIVLVAWLIAREYDKRKAQRGDPVAPLDGPQQQPPIDEP